MSKTKMHTWYTYKNSKQASQAVAEFIALKIEEAINKNGLCTVALSGGTTPVVALGLLAQKRLAWENVHWYLADERCYPKGHRERNDLMLEKFLWSRLSKTNTYPINSELGAEAAASAYRETIKEVDSFDIVFLGLGPDGHTASLFPGNKALYDTQSVIPVFNSPKPPSDRVSLSINTIQKAQSRIILATGKEKASIIKNVRLRDELPINCIGKLTWFVDSDSLSVAVSEKSVWAEK